MNDSYDPDEAVKLQLATINLKNGDKQVLNFSSYVDDTMLFVGEPGTNPKIISLSREQMAELYEALGSALEIRVETLTDDHAHFTNEEIQESSKS
jgi:hypothetical protein